MVWGEKDLKDHQVPTPILWAGTPQYPAMPAWDAVPQTCPQTRGRLAAGAVLPHTYLHVLGHGVTEVNQLQSMRHANQRFTSGQAENSGALHAQRNDLWVLCAVCAQTQTRLCSQHLAAGTFPCKNSQGGGTWAIRATQPLQGSQCHFMAHLSSGYPLFKVWRAGCYP